jgi:hypothetical protein
MKKTIEEKIKEINNTMELEGMPLTKENKKVLEGIFKETTTPEKEIKKIKDKYRAIYG